MPRIGLVYLTTLTGRLQTLNKSIYKANYCSPKRAGQHELVFTVKGNGAAGTASCKRATFPSSVVCNKDPSFTEGCGDQYCCPANAPYYCHGTQHCLVTAEAAKLECDTSCTHCGGNGQPQSSGAEGGAAIRVPFVAQSCQSLQCPAFHGPACKALDVTCPTLPGQLQAQCLAAVEATQGNEAQCSSQTSACPDGQREASCTSFKATQCGP